MSQDYESIQKELMQNNENIAIKTPMQRIENRTAGSDIHRNRLLDNRPVAPDLQEVQFSKEKGPDYVTGMAGVKEAKSFEEKHDRKYKPV